MLVGFLRLASVWFGFFDIWALRLAVFSDTAMTEVHGRTFGVWTLLTCTLCFLCAFNLDNKPLYLATFLSFIYALGHFLTEYLIYQTMAVANLTTVGIFAGLPLHSLLSSCNSVLLCVPWETNFFSPLNPKFICSFLIRYINSVDANSVECTSKEPSEAFMKLECYFCLRCPDLYCRISCLWLAVILKRTDDWTAVLMMMFLFSAPFGS
ncbi:unnamed protein product [Dovyalis caffra]|uniref:Ergosterol biosynthetic protein 28 n=1 Tax=Dovyalis caffra TaxID=77055 RepID=A0AAV1S8Y7_9ROSI|nr:unnamed protein product [Dovyalis caffra]